MLYIMPFSATKSSYEQSTKAAQQPASAAASSQQPAAASGKRWHSVTVHDLVVHGL